MSDDIQTRISVGQAFNIEAQRVLNNAKVDGKMISSMVMNAEIKAGILHTYDNIKGIQESMIVSKQVADKAYTKPQEHKPVVKQEQVKDTKNVSSTNSTKVVEQAFEV